MIAHVRPPAADSPELAIEQWEALAGLTPASARLERGILLACAEAYPHDFQIASVWDAHERELLGVAIGCMYDAMGPGRLLRSVVQPGHLDDGEHGRGVRLRRGVEPAPVLRALVDAWRDRCRAAEINRLLFLSCRPDDAAMAGVAAAEGGRPLPTGGDNRILLDRPTSYDDFVQTLGAKRRNSLRKDLDRPGEHGARVVSAPPTAEVLARIWPLQADYFERRAATFRPTPGVDLFALLLRHVPSELFEVLLCERGDALLGFILSYRTDATTQFMFVGHVADDPLQIYTSLVARMLKRDLDTGATRILLGAMADDFKKRLGARLEPRVNYYFPVALSPAEGA